MSDRYRPPPVGPRSGREGSRGDKSYRSGRGGGGRDRGNFKSGPRRPGERDNYRPRADTYKPERHEPVRERPEQRAPGPAQASQQAHTQGSVPSGPSGRLPSGPSSYRGEESGNKRSMPPSEPSSLRKKRDFHTERPNDHTTAPPPAKAPEVRENGMREDPRVNPIEHRSQPDQRNHEQRNQGDQRNQDQWSQRNQNNYQRNPSEKDRNSAYPPRDQQRERARRNRRGDYRGGRGDYRGRGSMSERGGRINGQPRGAKQEGGRKFGAESKRDNAPEPNIKLKPSQIYSIRTVRPSEAYKIVQQVGEGTYGKVYKAKNSITDENVAMKRLRLESEKEGFPITAIREIKLLQSFNHPNVVGLLEMIVDHNQIFMVFDYMDHDLTGLLTHPDLTLGESHRKYIFKQLLDGLHYLHKKRIIHRDIKGSNILVDNVGELKIADFGLARPMKILKNNESPDYTNRVITIWYRPPELLLGATDYGREVDIWGVGCLLVELYTKNAMFQGFDEIGQLTKIFSVMGTPTLSEWPDIANLPWFEMMKPKINLMNRFRKMYEHILTPAAFDLTEKLLCMNPNKRLDAGQALQHAYFTESPKPEPLTFLKEIKGEWHEFETKKRRRMERKRLQDEARENKESKAKEEDDSRPQTTGSTISI